MATSALLTRPSPPSSLHHRHLYSHPKPLSFLYPPTTNTTTKTPLRHSVEHLQRTKIPLRHFVEHLPRTNFPTPPRSLPRPLDSSLPSWRLTLTPLTICRWALLLSLTLFLVRTLLSLTLFLVRTLFSPFFWTYLSMSWVFWPWQLALLASAVALHSLRLHLSNRSNPIHQLAILSTSIMWLTLVPPAHFNGFLEGWPLAFFLLYHYFFFLEASVRRLFYGDLCPRPHHPKWDITPPLWARSLFSVLVFAGHWFAAREAPELHLMPGGWLANVGISVLIVPVLLLRYNSLIYLAKYSEKVAEPTAVVQFGPYRWLRHPEYASATMLFACYCLAMRAPRSMVFVVAVCTAFYGWKAQMEEQRMTEEFEERYAAYARKVRYRLIPFLY